MTWNRKRTQRVLTWPHRPNSQPPGFGRAARYRRRNATVPSVPTVFRKGLVTLTWGSQKLRIGGLPGSKHAKPQLGVCSSLKWPSKAYSLWVPKISDDQGRCQMGCLERSPYTASLNMPLSSIVFSMSTPQLLLAM